MKWVFCPGQEWNPEWTGRQFTCSECGGGLPNVRMQEQLLIPSQCPAWQEIGLTFLTQSLCQAPEGEGEGSGKLKQRVKISAYQTKGAL